MLFKIMEKKLRTIGEHMRAPHEEPRELTKIEKDARYRMEVDTREDARRTAMARRAADEKQGKMIDVLPGIQLASGTRGTPEDYQRYFWQGMTQMVTSLNTVDGTLMNHEAVIQSIEKKQLEKEFRIEEAIGAIANMLNAAAKSDQILKGHIDVNRAIMESAMHQMNEANGSSQERLTRLEEEQKKCAGNWTVWGQSNDGT